MESPLIIIVELLFGVINGIYKTLTFVFGKLGELLISLLFFSALGIFGFFLAVAIGAIVFILMAKFIFKTWKSLFVFGIALLVTVAVLVLLWMI